MFIVGITGGIGSGKTTVCKIFEVFGVPVYYADERAKWLLNNDNLIKESVISLLGSDAYLNGLLNRVYIANKVFNDSTLLEAYNNIIHPAVAEDTLIFSSKYLDKPYILKEAALLVETGSYLTLDKLILVTSSLQERINRVIQRDNVTEKEVLVRIKNQLPEEEKLKVADYIIVNDGNSSLIEQVKAIHQELLLMAY